MKFDDIKRQIFSDLSKDEIQELISVLILETTKEHSFPTAQELDRVNFNMTESPIKRITLSPIVNKAEIVFIKKYFHLFEDLETLILSSVKLEKIPDWVLKLTKLRRLDLSNTDISKLSDSFGQLINLQALNLSNTKITELPDSFGQLTHLQELDLSNTKITELPDSFGQLINLVNLNLGDTDIAELPSSIKECKKLKNLYLNGTQMIKNLNLTHFKIWRNN